MSRYEGPIIDVDVHHVWKSSQEVVDYLPQRWREYLSSNPKRALLPVSAAPNLWPNSARLVESFEPGGTRGTDYDILVEKLLDPHNYHRCVLTHDVGHYGAHFNTLFGAAIARAANDWTIERWLARDDRFVTVALVALGDPPEAAKEIRRVGSHPQIVGVCFAGNPLGRPFGDPIYDPIYEAAVEMGLHIGLHVGAVDRPGVATANVGGPVPPGILKMSLYAQQAMHYISSFIAFGTFERFPQLKVLVKEFGLTWLPGLLWRLDAEYETLRLETPYVKRWPSEYVRDHIKLSTQPIEEGPSKRALIQLLETVDGIDDLLCFSSDWPHLSADDPSYAARVFPDAWRRKIFFENACDFFGWDAVAADRRVQSTEQCVSI